MNTSTVRGVKYYSQIDPGTGELWFRAVHPDGRHKATSASIVTREWFNFDQCSEDILIDTIGYVRCSARQVRYAVGYPTW